MFFFIYTWFRMALYQSVHQISEKNVELLSSLRSCKKTFFFSYQRHSERWRTKNHYDAPVIVEHTPQMMANRKAIWMWIVSAPWSCCCSCWPAPAAVAWPDADFSPPLSVPDLPWPPSPPCWPCCPPARNFKQRFLQIEVVTQVTGPWICFRGYKSRIYDKGRRVRTPNSICKLFGPLTRGDC